MKFLITFNHVEGAWDHLSPRERQEVTTRLRAFRTALVEEKNSDLVYLHAADKAKTVRLHPDGTLDVSDGAYREDAEYPGGYYVIEAESMEEAVEWAKRGRFLVGSNEVREIHDLHL